jgi:hypothetical protein
MAADSSSYRRVIVAFVVAPLACPLPLLPVFAAPRSPLSILRFFPDNVSHPAPVALGGVVLIALIFGYAMEVVLGVPLFFLYRYLGVLRARLCIVSAAGIGMVTPQVVNCLQNFQQPELREWVASFWIFPIGAAAGLVSGLLFVKIARFK